ncbi:SUR7/PalI family-domain-containing protein [Pterulicium gracile]|uniref:SUR7/PalI family-domain-containing protein n=1 Tax=Pterulicium gracile TaxID=1884261 RepID=A0A5C3Q772_9AGAR|nr:SUR7/PalI family-domain-containing protein [Pterula gracilis]
MSRVFCIPGIVFLLCALVLSFLVSISLPYLTALDIVRTTFDGSDGVKGVREVRFGIWSHCEYDAQDDARTCAASGVAYHVTVQGASNEVTIGNSWTRGLAIHPVATAATFVAFLLSFSTHTTVTLVASLVSFLAALITLIAFAVDIALFAYVKNKMGDVEGVGANTRTGAGFWMTFVSFILLLLAGCTVCFGRRRDRMSTATTTSTYDTEKRGFMSRFRRRPRV